MSAIFISYRRDDAEGEAGRLFADLANKFGPGAVFMDVEGIAPGRDFRKVIDSNVASCGVLLAIIGQRWVDVTDDAGRRRLDDPMDFVRLETASALKRDIPVIPVLVHGARMPRVEQLPADIKDLAYRNGVDLTHARWNSDVAHLVSTLPLDKPKEDIDTAAIAIRSTAKAAPAARVRSRLRPVAAAIAAIFIVAVSAGGYEYRQAELAAAQRAIDAAAASEAAAKQAAAQEAAVRAAEEAAKDAGEKAAARELAANQAAAMQASAREAAANRAVANEAAARKAAEAIAAKAVEAQKLAEQSAAKEAAEREAAARETAAREAAAKEAAARDFAAKEAAAKEAAARGVAVARDTAHRSHAQLAGNASTVPQSSQANPASTNGGAANDPMAILAAALRATVDAKSAAQQAQWERQFMGVVPTSALHNGAMHGPTPNQIPGGYVITTRELIELLQKSNGQVVLLDVLGAAQKLPNAIGAVGAGQPGSFNDANQIGFGQWLNKVTRGNRAIPVVLYCQGLQCWMSYNAALRAINLGYRQVLWYRGGLEAWQRAGLPLSANVAQAPTRNTVAQAR